MNDLYLIRNKQTGKYFRQMPTLGGVRAICDVDLHIKTMQSLFMFETPEAAFQFLRNQGSPLPKDTEVVPFSVKAGDPVKITDIHATPHVSVALPVDAQAILSDPKATPEEIKATFAKEIVTPDPDHAPPQCTCQRSVVVNCPVHGC